MTLYLEQYLDGLESLPVNLRKSLSQIQDLDVKVYEHLHKVESLVRDYVSGVKGYTDDQKNKALKEIDRTFERARTYSDEKVTFAQSIYDIVDRHIRTLDNDLAKFEADLKEQFGAQKTKRNRRSTLKRAEIEKSRRRRPLDDETPRISLKKRAKLDEGKGRSTSPGASGTAEWLGDLAGDQMLQTLATAAGDVLDMPVDPNEPKYCVCDQVSYGEMIACDNQECTIEWFHFNCVGLTSKPKGKWFCPKCKK